MQNKVYLTCDLTVDGLMEPIVPALDGWLIRSNWRCLVSRGSTPVLGCCATARSRPSPSPHKARWMIIG